MHLSALSPRLGGLVVVALALGCSAAESDGRGRSTGGTTGTAPADAGAVLVCAPGELELPGGGCQAPGVPADACGAGFASDGTDGCVAILPAAPCGPGEIALPGERTCRPVAPCGAGSWGEAPLEGDTQYVDASYVGGASDGTAAMPWTTIQAGVDAAQMGAVVAIAPGSYAESVVIDAPVRLWGKCPGEVTIAGAAVAITVEAGAGGTEVHDLAVTSPSEGVTVLGVTAVVLDRVWIHGTGLSGLGSREAGEPADVSLRRSLVEGAGVVGVTASGSSLRIEDSVVRDTQSDETGSYGRGIEADDGARGSTVTLVRSIVEHSREFGVLAYGSDITIEDSLVRDTLAAANVDLFGAGVEGTSSMTKRRSHVTLLRSVVEGSNTCGVCVRDSDLDMDASAVRDTTPHPADDTLGFGVRAYGADHSIGVPKVSLRRSVVERSYTCGVAISGCDGELEGLVIRDIEFQPSDKKFGRGVTAEPTPAGWSTLALRGSRIERTYDAGVMILGAEATIDQVLVADTRSSAKDGRFGFGISFVFEFITKRKSTGSIHKASVEAAHMGGIVVAGSEVTAEDVVVKGTLPQPDVGDFGDGLIASSYILENQLFPTSLVATRATVEKSARAGVASFGANIELGASLIDCNPVPLNGEVLGDMAFSFSDLGDNQCSCDAEASACAVLSSGLAPPDALSF